MKDAVIVHDKAEEAKDLKDIITKKRYRKSIDKEFQHLLHADDKHFNAEFVAAQAAEIIKYLYRLKLTPLRAWESFILNAINRDKSVFLYDFYLKENEFGQLEVDQDRIDALILEDNPEDQL